jgi:hypothetical protein
MLDLAPNLSFIKVDKIKLFRDHHILIHHALIINVILNKMSAHLILYCNVVDGEEDGGVDLQALYEMLLV